jgi:hypothetical protein
MIDVRRGKRLNVLGALRSSGEFICNQAVGNNDSAVVCGLFGIAGAIRGKAVHHDSGQSMAFKARDHKTLEADVDKLLTGFGSDYRLTFS